MFIFKYNDSWGDYMNKNDLRVIKTKNALFETLTNLMKEKTFEEIKVSDICNKASHRSPLLFLLEFNLRSILLLHK